MSSLPNLFGKALRLSGIALLFNLPCFAAGIAATATFTGVADPVTAGVYDYSLTLHNTGTTTIGTFWFAWIPGAGFLSSVPSSVSSPAGWSALQTNKGAGIQWTTSNLLQAGDSLSGFNFVSAETPAQLLSNYTGTGTGAGLPQTTSFVYIARPTADPGYQFVATAATPEPGTILLTLTGLSVAAGSIKRRLTQAA